MRKTGVICMILGAALILSALLLIVYNNLAEQRAAEAAESLLPTLRGMIDERLAARAEESAAVTEPPPPEWVTPETDASETTAPAKPEPTVTISGRAYLGYLTIPSLELELPVMAECDMSKLKLAPCRQFGTAEGEDLVIAGHNYKRHFGKFTEIKATDLMLFTDMDGTTYVYEVGAVEMLKPDQVSEMKVSEWALSLYTCTLVSNDRLTVRCRLIETIPG